jgi:hypothetical protein
VYLRESRRRNKDGTVVSYLQLAHNERHPVTGSPVTKVIHNFGRADKVDRAALARLVASISRFLEPGPGCGSSWKSRAWTHAEGPYRLFGQAVGWLRRHRVLLPGVSVLARLVASVRDGAAERMYRSLAEAAADADPGLATRLRGLLRPSSPPEPSRYRH